MSTNVISFAERVGQHRIVRDGDPRAAEEKHRAAERMKLREIQKLYEKPEAGLLKWNSREDRLRAAQALGKLIEKAGQPDAGKPQVTMTQMKKKWRDLNNNSEFHIHRYMVSPKLDLADPQIVAEQAKKLTTRSVLPYAKRAIFIATLAELDPEESEIAIFRNTSFWQRRRPTSKNDRLAVVDDAAEAVAFLIERLSARVIRDTNLADLFARMRRIPGQWDIRTGSLQQGLETCLVQTAYQDWNEMWDEAPPLPSIPLVRLWHGDISFPVRLSREASAEPIAAHTILAPLRPEEGEERLAEVHVYREIRLALGPTVNADALGPLFESRIHAELGVLGDDGKISSRGVLAFDSSCNLRALNPDGSAAVLFDDCWHRFTPLAVLHSSKGYEEQAASAFSGLHVESPFLWDFTPLADHKQCFENSSISWTAVDATHVAHWLDRPRDGWSQPVEFLFPNACEPRSAPDSWYPWEVLAHFVEKGIYDGRLEAALQAETARVRKAFETLETEWRTRLQEQTAEQTAKFDSDLTAANKFPNQQMERNNDHA